MTRAWSLVFAAATCASLLEPAPGTAAERGAEISGTEVATLRQPGGELAIADLGGVLLGAVAPELGPGSGLFLLVRPARERAGERTLLHLRLEPEPRLTRLASGLDGRLEGLAAMAGGADEAWPPRLVAWGKGALVDLGAIADLGSSAGLAAGTAPPRTLAIDPAFDPASFATPAVRRGVARELAATEPGRLMVWRNDGADGRLATIALPFAVTRADHGLRAAGLPVTAIEPAAGDGPAGFLVGPEPLGSVRLRSFRVASDANAVAERAELWASLPGPERVARAWPFEIDGAPFVVVRTQGADEMKIFERQRLRVLPLAADRTRAGAAPTLAVELDSKRWHEVGVALADVDRDGHDDLLAVYPEGLSGDDVVAQWWAGRGGGAFDPKPRRSDVEKAPRLWALVASRGGGEAPGILFSSDRRIEWRPFTAAGRRALADRAELAVEAPPLPALPAAVSAAAGDGKQENVDPDVEPLGAAELDGRPGLELLAIQPDGRGVERLLVVRPRAP